MWRAIEKKKSHSFANRVEMTLTRTTFCGRDYRHGEVIIVLRQGRVTMLGKFYKHIISIFARL